MRWYLILHFFAAGVPQQVHILPMASEQACRAQIVSSMKDNTPKQTVKAYCEAMTS